MAVSAEALEQVHSGNSPQSSHGEGLPTLDHRIIELFPAKRVDPMSVTPEHFSGLERGEQRTVLKDLIRREYDPNFASKANELAPQMGFSFPVSYIESNSVFPAFRRAMAEGYVPQDRDIEVFQTFLHHISAEDAIKQLQEEGLRRRAGVPYDGSSTWVGGYSLGREEADGIRAEVEIERRIQERTRMRLEDLEADLEEDGLEMDPLLKERLESYRADIEDRRSFARSTYSSGNIH